MSVCVLQPSSQRPAYPQTRPPTSPAVQAVHAAPAAAEPSQVSLFVCRCTVHSAGGCFTAVRGLCGVLCCLMWYCAESLEGRTVHLKDLKD